MKDTDQEKRAGEHPPITVELDSTTPRWFVVHISWTTEDGVVKHAVLLKDRAVRVWSSKRCEYFASTVESVAAERVPLLAERIPAGEFADLAELPQNTAPEVEQLGEIGLTLRGRYLRALEESLRNQAK